MASQSVNLDRLLKAMRGGDVEIGRGEAFALLAASPYPQREELLGGVLQDHRESSAIRSGAAIALGRIPTHDSEQILLANLHAEEPMVQAEVLRALGRVGGRDAIAAIDSLGLPARDVAEFATALIAHRLRLDGHDLTLPAEEHLLKIPGGTSHPMRASTLTPEQTAKVSADLARQPCGIDYDQEKLVRLECAGRVNVVCPNRDLSTPDAIASLVQHKALAGVVALESPETGDHSISYLLLIAPSKSSDVVNIIAPRCSGRPGLVGTGDIAGDQLEFRLRAVERPGAFPMELAGEFSAVGLRFSQVVISLEQVASRRPALRPAM